ncbi:myelin-associated glycoprotein [Thunnus thynnus]|uniref:myelin-associated glycoprotein n=1 Tax=Thunnus thynnus TaxID=8237 RepID=UPI003528D9DE
MENERKMMIFCLLLAALCSPVLTGEWTATVPENLDALVTSCVVIPCSFTQAKERLPHSRLRGIWHRPASRDDCIYHEDKTRIVENFRGRTELLGNLGDGNCTLLMTEIKDHDDGPFCFRIELVPTGTQTSKIDKFSFVEDCVRFKMITEPPKPSLIHPKTAVQGRPYTITCSVRHTCPSHIPKLTWSRGTKDDINELHREIHGGFWEVQSTLIVIPEEKDDHTDITCTAKFNGPKTSTEKMTLYIKRKENYNHIIIPAVVGIGTAVIFGGLCIFMMKKYKNRIAELQSQEGSMWNRLSRMSRRIRSDGPGPSHTDRRRSIWSRFSRRPNADRSDLDHMPNNESSKSGAYQKTSKPRFPSPKSQPKSYNYKAELDDGDDYINTADLNVYGNL